MFLYCGRLIISVAHHFYLQSVIYPSFLQPSIFRLLLFAKFNNKILRSIVYFCSTFLIIKNEELRINNNPKNKRRRIYD